MERHRIESAIMPGLRALAFSILTLMLPFGADLMCWISAVSAPPAWQPRRR